MYVAQENVMLDHPSEPLQHPMIDELFDGFDVAVGAYRPNAALLSRYDANAVDNDADAAEPVEPASTEDTVPERIGKRAFE